MSGYKPDMMTEAVLNHQAAEIAKLREVLQRIADHHEEQRSAWNDEEGDADQARYHEERRNFALFHLTPNAGIQARP